MKDWNNPVWDMHHEKKSVESTAPMCEPVRVKRNISIQEINDPPAPTTFDTTAVYPSDALPDWFSGLQSIVEDQTFTSMAINISNGKVFYAIRIAGDKSVTSRVDVTDITAMRGLLSEMRALVNEQTTDENLDNWYERKEKLLERVAKIIGEDE